MSGSSRLAWGGLIAEYRDLLPVTDDAAVITLGEGATPLIPAPVLSERTGCQVYLKVEGANPTGSFKDRGMTVAVTMAVAHGAQAVICASTGNTARAPRRTRPGRAWPARCSCRGARSPSASWPRP